MLLYQTVLLYQSDIGALALVERVGFWLQNIAQSGSKNGFTYPVQFKPLPNKSRSSLGEFVCPIAKQKLNTAIWLVDEKSPYSLFTV